MAVVYIPDNLLAKILATGKEKQTFIKEAVEEKLLKFSWLLNWKV